VAVKAYFGDGPSPFKENLSEAATPPGKRCVAMNGRKWNVVGFSFALGLSIYASVLAVKPDAQLEIDVMDLLAIVFLFLAVFISLVVPYRYSGYWHYHRFGRAFIPTKPEEFWRDIDLVLEFLGFRTLESRRIEKAEKRALQEKNIERALQESISRTSGE
jgi:hypothetical protein